MASVIVYFVLPSILGRKAIFPPLSNWDVRSSKSSKFLVILCRFPYSILLGYIGFIPSSCSLSHSWIWESDFPFLLASSINSLSSCSTCSPNSISLSVAHKYLLFPSSNTSPNNLLVTSISASLPYTHIYIYIYIYSTCIWICFS